MCTFCKKCRRKRNLCRHSQNRSAHIHHLQHTVILHILHKNQWQADQYFSSQQCSTHIHSLDKSSLMALHHHLNYKNGISNSGGVCHEVCQWSGLIFCRHLESLVTRSMATYHVITMYRLVINLPQWFNDKLCQSSKVDMYSASLCSEYNSTAFCLSVQFVLNWGHFICVLHWHCCWSLCICECHGRSTIFRAILCVHRAFMYLHISPGSPARACMVFALILCFSSVCVFACWFDVFCAPIYLRLSLRTLRRRSVAFSPVSQCAAVLLRSPFVYSE